MNVLIFSLLLEASLAFCGGRYLLCTGKSSKIGDGEFSSEDEYEHAMLTRPPTRAFPDPEDSEESDDEEDEKLDRCSVLMRQLALESWCSFSWNGESEIWF